MKHEEQMVVTALQSVQNLLAAIKANPEKYIEHSEAIFELYYDSKVCNEEIKRAMIEPKAVIALNNCDNHTLNAKLKNAGWQ